MKDAKVDCADKVSFRCTHANVRFAELSDAVTQAQKTAHYFTCERFRITPSNEHGTDTGDLIYAVEPQTCLVAGHQVELRGNDDKIACFESYSRNMRAPETIAFEELFERATCKVGRIDKEF